MSVVIRNKVRDVIDKKLGAKQRISNESVSLDEIVETEDEEGCVGHAASDEKGLRIVYRSDIKQAIARVIEKLSCRQQKICRLFWKEGMGLREASRELHIPRATISDEILRIRKVFREEGMNGYL